MTKDCPMSNAQRARVSFFAWVSRALGIGAWTFIGHWTLVIGHLPGPFPLGSVNFQFRMRDEQVPHDGLKGFRVRGHALRVDRGDDDAGGGFLGGVASVAPDDAEDARAD